MFFISSWSPIVSSVKKYLENIFLLTYHIIDMFSNFFYDASISLVYKSVKLHDFFTEIFNAGNYFLHSFVEFNLCVFVPKKNAKK